MKVQIITNEKKFEPIELKITIDSEEALMSLYHRANVTLHDIKNIPSYRSVVNIPKADPTFALFSEIEKLIKARGLDELSI